MVVAVGGSCGGWNAGYRSRTMPFASSRRDKTLDDRAAARQDGRIRDPRSHHTTLRLANECRPVHDAACSRQAAWWLGARLYLLGRVLKQWVGGCTRLRSSRPDGGSRLDTSSRRADTSQDG